MTQKKILLTGATGNVGTQLAKQLAASNISFKALVRDEERGSYLQDLPEAEIVRGNLADEHLLRDALQGVERAFLLTNSSEQSEQLQLNFVKAAQIAGVSHIVKLSQLAADAASPVRFLRYHARVEDHIKETGMYYTFLRPNLYMQGLIAFKDLINADGKFYAPAGNAAISAVDVRDVASIAVLALTKRGHENKVYHITGGASITHYQMAEALSRVLGSAIKFIDISPGQMVGALKSAGFPEWQVGGLIEDYAHYARGEAAAVYSTVKELTGRDAVSFEQFVKDYKQLFL